MKNFLIVSDEELLSLEQRVVDFAVQKFGPNITEKIEAEVCESVDERDNLCMWIELKFLDFTYTDGLNRKHNQSVGMILEDRDYQLFCDNGKFLARRLFYQHTGLLLQRDIIEIHGVKVDTKDLYEEFRDYILTC